MLPMNKYNKNLQKALSISSTILGALLLFSGLGYFLYKKMDNEIWIIALPLIGVLVGLYEAYKQINK